MSPVKTYHLNMDKGRNDGENAFHILKRLKDPCGIKQSFKIIIKEKEYEVRKGGVYVQGERADSSTINELSHCLVEALGLVDYMIASGIDVEDDASPEETRIKTQYQKLRKDKKEKCKEDN